MNHAAGDFGPWTPFLFGIIATGLRNKPGPFVVWNGSGFRRVLPFLDSVQGGAQALRLGQF
jgi:hypothetical protein